MNKVITVNLNGNAYQIDEDGYNALRDYLGRAEAQLHASADKREVITDLEQAIADKCITFLRPHKNVITAAEVTQILTEIGPVQTADGQTVDVEPPRPQTPPPRSDVRTEGAPHQRRLYRIREGRRWAGVCTGVAAYTDIDVTLIRVLFVVAAVCTGVGLLAYIVMAFMVPMAYSESELAAAHSRPPELRRN